MTKPVVVVESMVKAKTLEEHLGGEVDILLLRSLPVHVAPLPPGQPREKGGPDFSFIADDGEKESLAGLRSCQGRELYLAFDNDWRGALWAWAISGYWASLSAEAILPRRLCLSGLSGPALRESLRLLAPVRPEKGLAAHVRMVFDAALGRHLQRLLGTRSGPGGVHLNFMSLTTLFLLLEREAESSVSAPVSRWSLQARLASDAGPWDVRLREARGFTADGLLGDEKAVRGAIALFEGKPFEVVKVARAPFSIPPPAPYHLAALLHDCAVCCGLKPFAALAAVRTLYYGVAMDGRQQGLVTSFLPSGNKALDPVLAAVRRRAGARMGAAALGPEGEQEQGRGLILPVLTELEPEALQGKLADVELQVYRLVWSRGLASQMREATGEVLEIVLRAGEGCIFTGRARVLGEKGFLALFQGGQDQDSFFPPEGVREGQLLRCLQILPEKKMGTPQEYYNLESLAGDLADFSLELDGFGVALLQQLLEQEYLHLKPDGSLRCAKNTGMLVAVLHRALPSMKGIHLSAYLSQTMEEVISGRKGLAFALQQFEQTMHMRGEVLVKSAAPASSPKPGTTPPASQGIPEQGGVGPVAISPSLPPALPVPQEEARAEGGGPDQEEMPLESGDRKEAEVPAGEELRGGNMAVAGFETLGNEDFSPGAEVDPCQEEDAGPAVIAAREEVVSPSLSSLEKDEPGEEGFLAADRAADTGERVTVLSCPVCRRGRVVTRATPTGKSLYLCSDQGCEFMAWARPWAIPCQGCSSLFLVENTNQGGETALRCPRSGCGYQQPLPGSGAGHGKGLAPAPLRKVLVRRVVGGAGSGGAKKVRIVKKR